jgi:hypothetical protein
MLRMLRKARWLQKTAGNLVRLRWEDDFLWSGCRETVQHGSPDCQAGPTAKAAFCLGP